LFYNGVEITGAVSIPGYNPALLQVQFTGVGSSTLSFVYQSFDAAGKGSNFATYTINWLLALPVQQLELSTVVSGTAVTLNWKTSNEINTSRYIAERSTDNKTFVPIGVVAAAGNSSSTKNYSLPDDISAVTGTVIYYRIKLVDADGKITYSNTVVVKMPGVDGIKTWPNPFTAGINVALFSTVNTNVEMSITDVAGKIITRLDYTVVKGNNQLRLANLQQLAKGIYLLQVKSKNGGISFVQKITKE
jgi:Secretion system C-terminal sorting domain